MYTLQVRGHFNAALSLPCFPGPCARLHGATFHVKVYILYDGLLDGMKVKLQLDQLLQTLDHQHLNALACFKDNLPTLENLARHIALELPLLVHAVEIQENDHFSITYTQDS